MSSAYHPHSNLRAETAVKSGKRILLDNTKSDGSPNWDKVCRALMQHRNTPDAEFGLSPSQLIFGRPIRDFLPVRPGHYSPSEVWVDSRETRELAFRTRVQRGAERWTQNTRDLRPLKPGMRVMLQNQHGAGKAAKRWDRTGLVLDDLGHNKYRVKVDGSGRVTDRNRQFLRQFTPVTHSQPGPRPDYHQPVVDPEPQIIPSQSPAPVLRDPEPVVHEPEPNPVIIPQTPTPSIPPTVAQPSTPESPSFATPPSTPVASIPLRRSTRVSKPPERFGYDRF